MARILVVDDDTTFRSRLVAALRSRGHDASEAATYEEAVALAEQVGDPGLHALTLAALARELDTELGWRERARLGRRSACEGPDIHTQRRYEQHRQTGYHRQDP